MYDLIIEGGRVVDGSGRRAVRADVGIRAGRIAQIGELSSASAERRINAQGLIVAPGFIDIHSHSDFYLLVNPTAVSKVAQGVTAEVCGNCGFSAGPIRGEHMRREFDGHLSEVEVGDRWESLGEFLDLLEQRGTAVNFCTLVGQGNIRSAVVGPSSRRPDASDMARMQVEVERALDEGAIGVSTGLIYPPGCYADTDELAEVLKPAGRRGALYATHMRSEGSELESAVAEAIEIGRRSGARVQISHHKSCGPYNWGKVKKTLAMMDEAASSGVQVWADQYPYTATSTILAALLPDWVHDGGREAALERLKDADACARIKDELYGPLGPGRYGGGFDAVMIAGVRSDRNRWTEGRRLTEIAEAWETDPVGAMIRLLVEEELSVSMCNFVICEEDVETVMRHPRVCVGSDAGARRPDGPLGRGKPHPRSYGTFPRVLGEYVRRRGVIPLEEAVRKMTGLPAGILRLEGRGILAPGYHADVVVFDPDKVCDTATYSDPHQLARGIRWVLVNGRTVSEDGRVTGARPGKVMRLRSDGQVG